MRKLALLAAGAASLFGMTAIAADTADDPHIWLEEIEGERALRQVREWNAATAARLTETPKFEDYRTRAKAILDDERRIAYPDEVQGANVTNFWQDAKNIHGLWRIASLQSVAAGKPRWRTLLDLDMLSRTEGKNWVWKSAVCLKPTYDRCMVGMSDGGTDAMVWREFDMATARFVPGGFETPVAKSEIAWLDRDNLLIRSDFGPGTLTASGYGRQVRRWKRGTPLASAELLFEGRTEDVGSMPYVPHAGGRVWPMVSRSVSFWETEYHHMTPNGRLVRSPLPLNAVVQGVIDGRAVALLHADWKQGGQTHKAGSVVAYAIEPVLAGKPASVETVFAPTAAQAIEQVNTGENVIYIKLLENVAGKLIALRPQGGAWRQTPLALPANSVVDLLATGGKNDVAFASVEGFATPEALYMVRARDVTQVASLPPRFDAASVEVSQRWVTSKDGTRIPYFVVRPKGAKGPLPTLMHAYGGFRAASNPVYLSKHPSRLGPAAQFWVEEGGSFVLANIRGGGEFGPAWHESVLKTNRQKVFDDLHAVAEDLKASGLTSKLGISGRSNGGLLVGVAYTQRPELYDAVLMGVPLSDMKRYNKLLAGASWMGEYGDPDKPEEWAYISQYSPYQNLRKGADYPDVMIYTSTKDDRVHPGHARKMAARMAEQGHGFYYYENTEGGHFGTANHDEEAYRAALMLAYLNHELKGVK